MSNENRQAMIDGTYDRGYEAGRASERASVIKFLTRWGYESLAQDIAKEEHVKKRSSSQS